MSITKTLLVAATLTVASGVGVMYAMRVEEQVIIEHEPEPDIEEEVYQALQRLEASHEARQARAKAIRCQLNAGIPGYQC